MEKKFNGISKLLLTAGCVSLITAAAAISAPLTYDMQQPNVRSDYNAPNTIKLKGDVTLGHTKGQKVTLSLRNTDVQQVLRMFADKAGLNIVFHQSATGTVTLDLVDVNLEDAFNMVMKMTNLTYVIKGNTMMVVSTGSAETVNLTKDNITIIPVKYADAAYLAQFLNTNIFSLNAEGLSYGPIVTTNAQNNELLVFGTDNDVEMAKKIVDKFDKRPVMTTYRVNHTTPMEMASMICETLFQLPFTGTRTSSGTGAGVYNSQLSAEFKQQTTADKAEDGAIGKGTTACVLTSGVKTANINSYQAKPTLSVYVQPELGTLTLVGGSEQQIQMVNDFILKNDRKQPQAFLEISIVELTEEGSKELNNTWNYQGKHVGIGFGGNEELKGMTTISGSNGGPIVWHGPNTGHVARSLNQTINYLISNSKARKISNPKLVITNGKESTIDLTQDYIESTTVQFVSANNSGESGTNFYAQKTYEIGNDNGIKITVLPFISPDGYVSLNIKPDYSSPLSNVEDKIGGVPYVAATLLQRHNFELKSVRIKDEETLVLGGFITNTENESVAKIPILGDIPLVGFLFRSQSKGLEKREIIFTITPRIIKDTEDVTDL